VRGAQMSVYKLMGLAKNPPKVKRNLLLSVLHLLHITGSINLDESRCVYQVLSNPFWDWPVHVCLRKGVYLTTGIA
jgi:hypothetical protein